MTAFGVQTVQLDLPAVVGEFSRRLRDAGVPAGPERAARFASALETVRPVARRRLYWTARAVFVCDPLQVRAFDTVFAAVFGAGRDAQPATVAPAITRQMASPPDERPERPLDGRDPSRPQTWSPGSSPAPSRRGRSSQDEAPVLVPTVASDEEVLRAKRFDALDPDELTALYQLMSQLALATPERRMRRFERTRRRGGRVDLRRTLRASLRTGGDPVSLAHRRRRIVRRRLVLLCDISGSMEPYARAYLQFLTCAARTSDRVEAFAFATRLTRITRALDSRDPERAIRQAAAVVPDWSSGTRIGEALKTFNDRYGRRGMARGAVVVILSDGWERGDPTLVGQEMERLARLAYRIVWVNPRVAAAGFEPRVGGMAAALPHCDALVSGHSLEAMREVAAAIGGASVGDTHAGRPAPPAEAEDEPWGSAGWVGSYSGSSVAMPSGYGPSRGRTTPGWSLGR